MPTCKLMSCFTIVICERHSAQKRVCVIVLIEAWPSFHPLSLPRASFSSSGSALPSYRPCASFLNLPFLLVFVPSVRPFLLFLPWSCTFLPPSIPFLPFRSFPSVLSVPVFGRRFPCLRSFHFLLSFLLCFPFVACFRSFLDTSAFPLSSCPSVGGQRRAWRHCSS